MVHREFQPNILLAPYIETYSIVCGYKEKEEFHKILPDGCIDIIFSLDETSVQLGLDTYCPNLIGTMTTYSEGSYSDRVNLLGIRFKPTGFAAFTKVPICEFTDLRINLTLIESLFDKRFCSELPEKTTTEARIQYLDSFFIEKLKNVFEPECQIVYTVDLIRETKGLLSLTEVANKSCLSLRHFERKFKATVGVSPKTFSRIVRFQHTISYLKKNDGFSLFSTAIDCGYYDQAHLIKEFKTLSSNSPSFFKS